MPQGELLKKENIDKIRHVGRRSCARRPLASTDRSHPRTDPHRHRSRSLRRRLPQYVSAPAAALPTELTPSRAVTTAWELHKVFPEAEFVRRPFQ